MSLNIWCKQSSTTLGGSSRILELALRCWINVPQYAVSASSLIFPCNSVHFPSRWLQNHINKLIWIWFAHCLAEIGGPVILLISWFCVRFSIKEGSTSWHYSIATEPLKWQMSLSHGWKCVPKSVGCCQQCTRISKNMMEEEGKDDYCYRC